LKHQGAKFNQDGVVLIGLAVLCVVFGAALLFGLEKGERWARKAIWGEFKGRCDRQEESPDDGLMILSQPPLGLSWHDIRQKLCSASQLRPTGLFPRSLTHRLNAIAQLLTHDWL